MRGGSAPAGRAGHDRIDRRRGDGDRAGRSSAARSSQFLVGLCRGSGEAPAPGSGILCLGDSLAKDGLVSAVLTATTGVPTYNLSAPAAPAPMTECLFRRALDAGARPRAIVLELKPSLLAGGPRYRMRGWQEFLNFSETVSLIRSAAQHLVRHRSSSRADPAEPSRALRNSRDPARRVARKAAAFASPESRQWRELDHQRQREPRPPEPGIHRPSD